MSEPNHFPPPGDNGSAPQQPPYSPPQSWPDPQNAPAPAPYAMPQSWPAQPAAPAAPAAPQSWPTAPATPAAPPQSWPAPAPPPAPAARAEDIDRALRDYRPVSIDLDALEREGAALPFDFLLGGHRFVLSDPAEVDWQDLLYALGSPSSFFRLVLPADEHDRFFESKMPGWKMNRLMAKYQEHYGIPSLPNAGGLPR